MGPNREPSTFFKKTFIFLMFSNVFAFPSQTVNPQLFLKNLHFPYVFQGFCVPKPNREPSTFFKKTFIFLMFSNVFVFPSQTVNPQLFFKKLSFSLRFPWFLRSKPNVKPS